MSDPFLGHFRFDGRDYYVRQFHDMKGGIEMETLDAGPFRRYADVHSQRLLGQVLCSGARQNLPHCTQAAPIPGGSDPGCQSDAGGCGGRGR
ncbi:DUF2252 family protein [Microbacterium sp. NPDC078428]|uniref:DUF2252 family protein n=1 Tax=Microbacterium sp. NPDC078428 TaxID=3364190 RepID=UPI0037CB0263